MITDSTKYLELIQEKQENTFNGTIRLDLIETQIIFSINPTESIDNLILLNRLTYQTKFVDSH